MMFKKSSHRSCICELKLIAAFFVFIGWFTQADFVFPINSILVPNFGAVVIGTIGTEVKKWPMRYWILTNDNSEAENSAFKINVSSVAHRDIDCESI
jgi:hypothetical protein